MFGRNARVAGAGRRRLDARAAASTRRSRRRGSRSSTGRRSSCSPTRTSRTAPSRGCSPTSTSLPDISIEFATEPNRDGDVPAVPARPGDARARRGRSRARPGSSTGSAGSRRQDVTGNVSYDPDNHDQMVRLRAQKVAGIAADIPELEVDDPDGARRCSCSAGAARTARSPPAVRRVRKDGEQGRAGAPAHLNPFPRNLGDVLRALRPRARAGDEPRPAAEARARRVPRRRGRLQPGARPAVPRRASSPTRWRRLL